jgi:DNA polymerase/3'-5' exonuclease PolX
VPSNTEAAEIFRGIADLLDVMGERFKPEAYRRAARSIDSLTEDLGAIAARDELRSVPGVGAAIEEKIREYLTTGKVEYFDRLQHEVPPGVAELLRIPGLGPKTARRFWVELGIEGPSELRAAIDAGRLTGVKGFGEKKVAQIRTALDNARANAPTARLPLEVAYPVALRLVSALRGSAGADRVEVAGSFRRGRETVGDLDLLVTSHDPPRAFEVFSALPEIREIRLRGETKETVILTNGLQVDLRVVEPTAFGAALQYFTGSKEHNVEIRTLAKDRGLRVNEYGVFRGEERIAGATEEEVYASLQLAWIPPELREAHGEIDLAARGPLPRLVEAGDLVGDLHVHPPDDADGAWVDRLVAEAQTRHYRYVGVVVGGTDGGGGTLTIDPRVATRTHAASTSELTVVRVWESELPPPASSAAEVWLLRPTSDGAAPPPLARVRPRPRILVHLGSGAGAERLRAWTALAGKSDVPIEVGPGPARLDPAWARSVREAGHRLHPATGVGEGPESATLLVALAYARRAGAHPGEAENSRPLGAVSGSRSGARP